MRFKETKSWMEEMEIELLQIGMRRRAVGRGGKGVNKELRWVIYMYKFPRTNVIIT